MPTGYPECINPEERWSGPGRIMVGVSCGPAKTDGEVVSPCTTCRLVLKGLVNDEGKDIGTELSTRR